VAFLAPSDFFSPSATTRANPQLEFFIHVLEGFDITGAAGLPSTFRFYFCGSAVAVARAFLGQFELKRMVYEPESKGLTSPPPPKARRGENIVVCDALLMSSCSTARVRRMCSVCHRVC
jgi:hypothetical protein